MIKVALENPLPEGVKVSRKNTVLISITPDHTEDDKQEEDQLLEYFMQEQKPGWAAQFKRAIVLGPQIED